MTSQKDVEEGLENIWFEYNIICIWLMRESDMNLKLNVFIDGISIE